MIIGSLDYCSVTYTVYTEEDLADPHQIAKDIERSFYYYPQGVCLYVRAWYGTKGGIVGLTYIHQAGISSAQKARKQKELHDLIIEILWRNPRLKYYQARS